MFSYFAALMGGRRKGLRNGGKIYFHAKKVHLKGEEAPRKPCHSFKAQWTKGKFEFGECRGKVLLNIEPNNIFRVSSSHRRIFVG